MHIIEAFKMRSMTYKEFKSHLGKAGLTTYEFAEIAKMNRNSITNYSQKGEVPSHLALIAALLGEMRECNVDFQHILRRINIQPKKARGIATGPFKGGTKTTIDKIVK